MSNRNGTSRPAPMRAGRANGRGLFAHEEAGIRALIAWLQHRRLRPLCFESLIMALADQTI
jgi:hypothetical protein